MKLEAVLSLSLSLVFLPLPLNLCKELGRAALINGGLQWLVLPIFSVFALLYILAIFRYMIFIHFLKKKSTYKHARESTYCYSEYDMLDNFYIV
jgi:hypothetical protein